MTKPQLIHRADFEAVLSDYRISQAGKDLLAAIDLVLLVAPTSVGKNTIIDQLAKTDSYKSIVSDTTRPPREENGELEQHGVRYFFRTEEEILSDLQAGMFLEASLIHNQQVSGISLRELKVASDQSRIAINEVEVIGADKIVAAKPDAHAIFLLPPSFDEWLRRLQHRGTMTEQEIRNRMESMRFELEFALPKNYYHFVVNDDLSEAIAMIRSIVEDSAQAETAEAKARAIAEQLLKQVTEALS